MGPPPCRSRSRGRVDGRIVEEERRECPDWPQPEDRRSRRARGRCGRGPHHGAAGTGLRRRARGATEARPSRRADGNPGADRQPAAPAAVRADPGKAKKDLTPPAGQGDSRRCASAGPGREDPSAAGRRATASQLADVVAAASALMSRSRVLSSSNAASLTTGWAVVGWALARRSRLRGSGSGYAPGDDYSTPATSRTAAMTTHSAEERTS